jgi:squalene cyclase
VGQHKNITTSKMNAIDEQSEQSEMTTRRESEVKDSNSVKPSDVSYVQNSASKWWEKLEGSKISQLVHCEGTQ